MTYNTSAPLVSPALSGTPTAPTAANGTNTTQVATTAFVQSASAAAAGAIYLLAYLNTAQSVSNATATKAMFDTVSFDNKSWYDNTTNFRYTPLTAGKYRISVVIQLACSAATLGGASRAMIYKNGTEIVRSTFLSANTNNFANTVICASLVDMNGSTDYVEGWGIVGGSASCQFTGATGSVIATYLEIEYVGV